MDEQRIRQNMLILHNTVGVLADFLTKRKTLVKDEGKSCAKLKELFGESFFDLDKNLKNLKRDDIYKKCGFERTGIIKLCTGQNKTIPQKFLEFLKKRELMDDSEIKKFKAGRLYIALPSAMGRKTLDDLVKAYIKEFENVKKNENKRNEVDSVNSEINSKIVERICYYLYNCKDELYLDRYSCEVEKIKETENTPLPCDWLLRFCEAILHELKGDDIPVKVHINSLYQLKKKEYERLNPDEVKDMKKKLGEIYRNITALDTYRDWR